MIRTAPALTHHPGLRQHPLAPSSVQHDWLVQDLERVRGAAAAAAGGEVPWVVVTMHRMLYTTQVGRGLQLQSMWRIPAAAVSQHVFGRAAAVRGERLCQLAAAPEAAGRHLPRVRDPSTNRHHLRLSPSLHLHLRLSFSISVSVFPSPSPPPDLPERLAPTPRLIFLRRLLRL